MVAHRRVACTAKRIGCAGAPADDAVEHTGEEREEREDCEDTSEIIDSGEEMTELTD